jgi:hypothetical protein
MEGAFLRKVVGIYCLFLLPLFNIQAQQFTLLSATDSTAIPYANVVVVGTTRGTFSNEAGRVQLALQPTDSVHITAIGYQPLLLPAKYAKGLLYLQPQVKQLAEVEVQTRKKPFVVKKNYHKRSHNGGMYGSVAYLRWYYNDVQQPGELQKVHFRFGRKFSPHKDFDRNYGGDGEEYPILLRLIMYNHNQIRAPFEPILDKDYTFRVEAKATRYTLELEGVKFPTEGAFIGFEAVGYYKEGEFIPFSSSDMNSTDNFSALWKGKQIERISWQKNDFNSDWELTPPFKDHHNYMFGIEVAY